MDWLINILMGYGYWGMFVAAFLAGSVFPFSSETVMVALWAAGLDPLPLVLYGSAGNILGSVFNYCLGRMGRLDWLERWFHVSHESIEKAERFMGGHGAWIGFFAFLPLLGSAITVVLGLTRANMVISFLSISVGKFLRYWILIFGADHIF